MREKIIYSILPLILLLLLILTSNILTKKEFIISEAENLNCDNLISIGSKITSINDKYIESKKDFDNVINDLRVNQTFFIVADNKIIRCLWKNESKLDIVEVINKPIGFGINVERLYLENSEKNKKFLKYLGYSNFIEDDKYLILPYDSKLLLALSSKQNISFYIERILNVDNESVIIENKKLGLDELKNLFDEVVFNENNVTVRKFLFNQNDLIDFNYKITHLTYINVYYVTFEFEIDENASKTLNEYLQTIPIRLINFEKYYDAKLLVKVDNNVLLDFYLPYTTFERKINITLINFEDYKKVVETFSQYFLSKSEIKEEFGFKLFFFDIVIILVSSLLTLYLIIKKKIEKSSMIIVSPLIFSSLFFSSLLFLSFLILYLIFTLKNRKLDLTRMLIVIISLIPVIYYFNYVYFSIFFFFFSLLIYNISEFIALKYHKLRGILEILLGIVALSIYFFNPIISYSLLISVFAKVYREFYSY
ncbi:MAG: hypothetical protein QW197_00850 [Candidatus Aenigmatarchaeota archaeon]